MVDPIGPRPVKPSEPLVATVSRASASLRTAQDQPRGVETSSAQALAKEMATKPPVDSERVAKIRRAIANGQFPIEPTTIADRMIALKNKWVPCDQA